MALWQELVPLLGGIGVLPNGVCGFHAAFSLCCCLLCLYYRSASSLMFQFVVGASVHLGSELRFKLCDGGGLWVWAWTEVFADGRSCWFVQAPVVARRRIDGGWFDAVSFRVFSEG